MAANKKLFRQTFLFRLSISHLRLQISTHNNDNQTGQLFRSTATATTTAATRFDLLISENNYDDEAEPDEQSNFAVCMFSCRPNRPLVCVRLVCGSGDRLEMQIGRQKQKSQMNIGRLLFAWTATHTHECQRSASPLESGRQTAERLAFVVALQVHKHNTMASKTLARFAVVAIRLFNCIIGLFHQLQFAPLATTREKVGRFTFRSQCKRRRRSPDRNALRRMSPGA